MSVFYGKRGKTRRLIMQNSKALLETHGIEHVTMQDIADAANVSRTTVFNYFGSVKGVLDALCEDEVNAVREYCERKEKREDNRPDVRHVFEQLIKDAAVFPALIIRVISASIVEPGGCNRRRRDKANIFNWRFLRGSKSHIPARWQNRRE